MKKEILISTLLLIAAIQVVAAQEYVLSQSRNIHMLNSSYYGFNNLSKTGVLFSAISYDGPEKIDTKFAYSCVNFDKLNFSLGLDINSFNIHPYGLVVNQLNLSYVYQFSLNYNTIVLPAISLGIASRSLKADQLIFEDQLNLLSGYIAAVSEDPLSLIDQSRNHFDLGASVLIYNEDFLVGLSFKHLNQPDISFNEGVSFKKDLSMSLQGAYERNLNYYGQNFLPENSYLFLYFSMTSAGKRLNAYASQELQLSGFSFGIHENFSYLNEFSLLNMGVNAGVSFGNTNIDISYSFPLTQSANLFPPKMLELSMSFDLNPFVRNNSGDYKRLKMDNF